MEKSQFTCGSMTSTQVAVFMLWGKKCYKSGIFFFFLESLLLTIYQPITVRAECSSSPAHNSWPSLHPYGLEALFAQACISQQEWQWTTTLSIAINIQL